MDLRLTISLYATFYQYLRDVEFFKKPDRFFKECRSFTNVVCNATIYNFKRV